MRRLILCLLLTVLAACSSKKPYDISNYYDLPDQDRILTEIVTYLFEAPPYTKMTDRFRPEHKAFYSRVAGRFEIYRYFISKQGIHYFYVVRPSSERNKRGVGGHFRMNGNFEISEFREEFVTPVLPEEEVKGRCSFLFDEMIKGSLGQYLKMETYVQWPNEISTYDTVTYEWKLKAGYEQAQ